MSMLTIGEGGVDQVEQGRGESYKLGYQLQTKKTNIQLKSKAAGFLIIIFSPF